MNCDELIACLADDRAVTGAEAVAHLGACDACRAILGRHQSLGSALKGARIEPSARVWAGIEAQLGLSMGPAAPSSAPPWAAWMGPIPFVVALLTVTVAIWLAAHRGNDRPSPAASTRTATPSEAPSIQAPSSTPPPVQPSAEASTASVVTTTAPASQDPTSSPSLSPVRRGAKVNGSF